MQEKEDKDNLYAIMLMILYPKIKINYYFSNYVIKIGNIDNKSNLLSEHDYVYELTNSEINKYFFNKIIKDFNILTFYNHILKNKDKHNIEKIVMKVIINNYDQVVAYNLYSFINNQIKIYYKIIEANNNNNKTNKQITSNLEYNYCNAEQTTLISNNNIANKDYNYNISHILNELEIYYNLKDFFLYCYSKPSHNKKSTKNNNYNESNNINYNYTNIDCKTLTYTAYILIFLIAKSCEASEQFANKANFKSHAYYNFLVYLVNNNIIELIINNLNTHDLMFTYANNKLLYIICSKIHLIPPEAVKIIYTKEIFNQINKFVHYSAYRNNNKSSLIDVIKSLSFLFKYDYKSIQNILSYDNTWIKAKDLITDFIYKYDSKLSINLIKSYIKKNYNLDILKYLNYTVDCNEIDNYLNSFEYDSNLIFQLFKLLINDKINISGKINIYDALISGDIYYVEEIKKIFDLESYIYIILYCFIRHNNINKNHILELNWFEAINNKCILLSNIYLLFQDEKLFDLYNNNIGNNNNNSYNNYYQIKSLYYNFFKSFIILCSKFFYFNYFLLLSNKNLINYIKNNTNTNKDKNLFELYTKEKNVDLLLSHVLKLKEKFIDLNNKNFKNYYYIEMFFTILYNNNNNKSSIEIVNLKNKFNKEMFLHDYDSILSSFFKLIYPDELDIEDKLNNINL